MKVPAPMIGWIAGVVRGIPVVVLVGDGNGIVGLNPGMEAVDVEWR